MRRRRSGRRHLDAGNLVQVPAWQSILGSHFGRLLGLGFLVLLLTIPIRMVRATIGERQGRRDAASAEVGASWGGPQSVSGPRLVVPYTERWLEVPKGGEPIPRTRVRHATFLPGSLDVRGKLSSSTLHRGIFEIPVFRIELALEGDFAPSFSDWEIPPEDVDWRHAELVLELAEVRAVDRASLRWGEEEFGFEPGAGASEERPSAVHVALGDRAQSASRFAIDLTLRGSERIHFAPFGQSTRVSLASDWPSPSFEGAWIPIERSVDRSGFEARWEISALGRGFPERWRSAEHGKAIEASRFGVRLLTPVDAYRMAERSAKYATLFLGLTFATFWLFDVLASARLHAVQYLLVGAAQCLFYLLEISLAEHLGFGLAYALASAGIVALIASYAWAVLRSAGRAAIVAGVVVAIYGYLYVVLTNEDYALLAGSLALFVGLAVVMWLTRRVDWRVVASRATAARAGSPAA